jgi:hypothetical protein
MTLVITTATWSETKSSHHNLNQNVNLNLNVSETFASCRTNFHGTCFE